MVQETHPVIKLGSSIALLWDVVFSRTTGQKNPFQLFTGSPAEPSIYTKYDLRLRKNCILSVNAI